MTIHASAPTETPKAQGKGCCCGTSSDAVKSAETGVSAKPASAGQDRTAKQDGAARTGGCCGGH